MYIDFQSGNFKIYGSGPFSTNLRSGSIFVSLCKGKDPIGRTLFLPSWNLHKVELFSTFISQLRACLHEGGGPQVDEVTCGGLPHLTCKRDHIKMRDYMDRRATPPKRVTSPIWGTPPLGRWGNPLRRGNAPVLIISHFNLITFTW